MKSGSNKTAAGYFRTAIVRFRTDIHGDSFFKSFGIRSLEDGTLVELCVNSIRVTYAEELYQNLASCFIKK